MSPLYWREAATLILATPKDNSCHKQDDVQNKEESDFEVLMVKRGKKSSFMANVHAFPGGVASNADFNRKIWDNLFILTTGCNTEIIHKDFIVNKSPRPPMMIKGFDSNILPPELGFRITAIRETFEESGILLVSDQDIFKSQNNFSSLRRNPPPIYPMPDSFDAKLWRQKISDDETEFYKLCVEYEVVPNIWALCEWSNWMTPVFQKQDKPPKKPHRFDTLFFLCCVDNLPSRETKLYTEEISATQWNTPMKLFQSATDKSITLIGPQLYDISRMSGFPTMEKLASHACEREKLGLERWMTVSYICRDGILFVLPGDELYPENPDYEGVRDILELDEKVYEVCKRAKHFHRGVRGSWVYYCNIHLACGLLKHRFAKSSFPNDMNLDSSKL